MKNPNRLLLILQYLWTTTDFEHPATIKEIISFLEENGITATRKTIAGDIEDLRAIGIEIDCIRSTQNRYYIDTRIFELPEVKLLVDAVQSARFITTKKSKALIKKLSSFVSRYQSDVLKRQLYVDSRTKAKNESVFYVVDNIHTAIRTKKKVSFQYLEYNQNKEKVLKYNGYVYIVSPYALLWNDDCYYLVGFSEKHQKTITFRVDRMVKLEITAEKARPKPRDLKISSYFSQIFSMFEGTECEIELLCENDTMKYIIERFGEGVSTERVDDDHFSATATVALSRMFYGWVFQFGGKIKLLSPDNVVDEYNKMLDDARRQQNSKI